MQPNLVSIVIPVFNGAGFLPSSVGSALAQTYPDLEVIIVNDGSADSTSEVASDLQKSDSRVRVLNIDNSGVTAARKAGIDNAVGEWICFLDADDTLPGTALETYSEFFAGNPEIIASGERELSLSEYKCGLMQRKSHPELWGKMFRADFIKAHYPLLDRSVTVGEDQIINIALAGRASHLETISALQYCYNLDNPSSVMRRFRRTSDYEILFEKAFDSFALPCLEPRTDDLTEALFKMRIEGFKMVVMDGGRFDSSCPEWVRIVEYYKARPDELAPSERMLLRLDRCQAAYGLIMRAVLLLGRISSDKRKQ